MRWLRLRSATFCVCIFKLLDVKNISGKMINRWLSRANPPDFVVSHNGDIMFLIIFDKILDIDNLRRKNLTSLKKD